MGAVAHFSIFFLPILFPLILWFVEKDKTGKEWVKKQAKQALIYHVTVAIIGTIIGVLLMLLAVVTFGLGGLLALLVFPLYGVVVTIFAILATIKAYHGEDYQYPIIGGLFQ